MKLKQVLKILSNNQVSFVIVGGVALNVHGSNRVTFDSDIVIKTVEIDMVIEILISNGLEMVIGVDKDQYPKLTSNFREALEFAERSKWGFLKFIGEGLELDVLYEIPVPFIMLYNESVIKYIGDIEVHVASLEHIKIMKEKAIEDRDDDKRNNDLSDLHFIEKKLNEKKI